MGLPESQAELSDTIIVESLKGPSTVERHYGVITQVIDNGVWAYLDGATAAPVGPLLYSGSVPPPNVGESWAFDVVQREWIAVFRLNAGPGMFDIFDPLGAAALAQANAAVHSDFSINCDICLPGLLSAAPTTLEACAPYEVFGRVMDARIVYLDIAVASPDLAMNGDVGFNIEWTWYVNAQAYQSLTLQGGPAIGDAPGAIKASAEIPCHGFGQPGDLIQGVMTYAGTTASSLNTHLRVF